MAMEPGEGAEESSVAKRENPEVQPLSSANVRRRKTVFLILLITKVGWEKAGPERLEGVAMEHKKGMGGCVRLYM